MFLLVLKYDGDNSEAKIGYAMMALEAYGCKVNHKSNYDFYRLSSTYKCNFLGADNKQ